MKESTIVSLGEWYTHKETKHLWQSDVFNEAISKASTQYFRSNNIVYPEPQNWLKAFYLCQPSDLKCVILGQD